MWCNINPVDVVFEGHGNHYVHIGWYDDIDILPVPLQSPYNTSYEGDLDPLADNISNIDVFIQQRTVQDQVKMRFNNGGEWPVNDKVAISANINWYSTNVEPILYTNNDNNFIIDYTNTDIANGSMIAANKKQLKM